jgi:tetratricopeptide (TPR) repeat protein
MIKIVLSSLLLSGVMFASPNSMMNKTMLEDTFTLYALDAQMRQKPHQASEYFAELYKQTSKKEYLYQSLRMLEQSNDTKRLSKSTADALALSPEDETLKRFEIIALLKEGNFSEASQKAAVLSEKTKKPSDYLLYAESRLKLDDYEGGMGALKNAYALTYDDATAERMALIQYANLGQKKEAIKFLKEHIGAHGNSKLIGKRLGSLYADSGAYEDAGEMYTQTYDLTTDPDAASQAVKIYLYTQNHIKLVSILEKSGSNDPLLLELYVKEKDFDKASALAQKLYEREDNPLFLAQSAVFAYEGAKNKNDPLMVAKVVEGLKKAAVQIDDPLYLNYLGYLMIEHDVNISEGMEYVRRALKKQPDSPYYIDSLAWGNYKLGECAEALRLMKQVESVIGSDEPEVKEHITAIEACKTKEK